MDVKGLRVRTSTRVYCPAIVLAAVNESHVDYLDGPRRRQLGGGDVFYRRSEKTANPVRRIVFVRGFPNGRFFFRTAGFADANKRANEYNGREIIR